jgi:hypothetical protein
MPKLDWRTDEYGCLRADAPIRTYHGAKVDHHPLGGVYEICIQRRPVYCDRGDWIIYVDGRGIGSSLDAADLFPRYFFGTEDEVKRQMETWASRRQECHESTTKTQNPG